MFDDVKQDFQLISSALEARLTPQWAAPQQLCHFRRDAGNWELNYLAPSPQGQSGTLLQLTRNGKPRFNITLRQPDTELPQWRDALREVVTDSDQRDAGWWLRLYLHLRGRHIECSRMVMQEQTAITPTATDLDRYYLARLSGWSQPCVLIVYSNTYKARSSTKVSTQSVRLLPAECHQMAESLHAFLSGPAAKPLAPLPQSLFNRQPAVSAKLIALIVLVIAGAMIATTVLPWIRLFAHH